MGSIWKLALALAAAITPTAAAADGWRHRLSGVSIPEIPPGLHRGRQIDNRRDGSDMIVQLGTEREPVTVYVYRGAFPNPALWFERVRHSINVNVDSKDRAVDPRPFTLGDAAAPNGLREEIELPAESRFRTSAVAIAQYGEWLVKVRITGQLGREEIRAKMDRLLAAIRLPGPVPTPLPLVIPAPCRDLIRLDARRLGGQALAVHAGPALRDVNAAARGRGGLAADAAAWCRVTDSAVPSQYGTLYRRRDGQGWVVLLSDSGIAIVAAPVDLPDSDGGGTFVTTSSMTGLVEIFDRVPAPNGALIAAMPVLAGRGRPVTRLGAAEAAPR